MKQKLLARSKKPNNPINLTISLDEKHKAGEFDHINVWIRQKGLKFEDYECKEGIWYIYNVTNLPSDLPSWVKVQ